MKRSRNQTPKQKEATIHNWNKGQCLSIVSHLYRMREDKRLTLAQKESLRRAEFIMRGVVATWDIVKK